MSRLVAIGDIHGQDNQLSALLDQVQPKNDDQLIFLGDYIDRGPDSRGVVERLIGLRQSFPQTVFLRGNHELMLLNALLEVQLTDERALGATEVKRPHALPSDIWLFLKNGGSATLQSYGVDQVDQLPRSHIEFIKQTRLYYQQDGYLFVHAGARTDLPLEQQDEYTLLWERNSNPGEKEIHVVGHQPTRDGLPKFEPGRYAIDTGAGFGRPLTACEVKTKEFWQA